MDHIFHHTDIDGQCCGAILTRKFKNAVVHPYNYFYTFERAFGQINDNDKIIFGDITPPTDVLNKLLLITKDITIIDHHSSSLDDLEKAGLKFPGIQTPDGLGACILVWQWCYPDKELPLGVKWIGEYDNWQRTNDNRRFNFGIKTYNTMPTNKIWDSVLSNENHFVNGILDTGSKVLSFLIPWYKRLIRSYSIEGKVDGYSALLMNQPNVDSSIFDNLTTEYDVYVRVVFGKDWQWLVSITTNREDVDVSLIAKKYGGGGHKKSSGFRVSKLEEFFINQQH